MLSTLAWLILEKIPGCYELPWGFFVCVCVWLQFKILGFKGEGKNRAKHFVTLPPINKKFSH